MTTLSEICIHLGRIDGATLLYDWLRPWDAAGFDNRRHHARTCRLPFGLLGRAAGPRR